MAQYSQENLTIKHWAEEDRPREKLSKHGRSVLSEAELIAILIGSGTTTKSAVDLSKEILHSVDNNLNSLARLGIKDLMKFNGIGEAKAISIVAALELGRRRNSEDVKALPIIDSSQKVYDFISGDLVDLDHEEFWIILLKRNNEIIKKVRISIGGTSGTLVDPKIVFKSAIEESSSAIILIHNHPSRQLKPSEADRKLTKRLLEAGKLMDITVLDHLIVTDKAYFSFADEGEM